MLIIPAIDLKGGACVRLRQGRMEDATVYSDDPVATATRWVEAGAKRLHIVDLDGAFAGKPANKKAVVRISAEHPNLPIQLGGGIRDLDTIKAYLDLGLAWVIIGTQAVKDPALVTDACHQFPGQIIVGVDAKDGWVATEGWAESSSLTLLPATDLTLKNEIRYTYRNYYFRLVRVYTQRGWGPSREKNIFL